MVGVESGRRSNAATAGEPSRVAARRRSGPRSGGEHAGHRAPGGPRWLRCGANGLERHDRPQPGSDRPLRQRRGCRRSCQCRARSKPDVSGSRRRSQRRREQRVRSRTHDRLVAHDGHPRGPCPPHCARRTWLDPGANSIARRKHLGWPPLAASFRPPELPGSRSAEVSVGSAAPTD
jgi:hypothetical protein